MAEDLNHFAKYQTFSSYSTIFNEMDAQSQTQALRRNPLEYYTKRGLDPPKTIYGDPAKILDHQDPQKQDQTKEVNIVGSVHHFASEINRLCQEVGKIIQKPQAIKDQLNHKKKKSQDKLHNHPSSDMQIQSLQQINSFNDFNSQIQQQNQQLQLQDQLYDQQHIRGNQSIRPNGLKQNLQLSLSPQNQQIDSLQQQVQNSQHRDEQSFHAQKKTVQQLYQRNHKSVFSVEEQSRKIKNNQKPYVSSLTELAQHQDEEIQKAIKILQGGQKKP
ncbi:unnamed protein product [Paramecium sonneborni]|uniref:Uncharacterized protein n=1 Tax=Paramecium sonneborni TaxID=65129 RepID=A0A8S1LLC6_9CILI|nr:unnamed protein product [Paramecium sonneborni]